MGKYGFLLVWLKSWEIQKESFHSWNRHTFRLRTTVAKCEKVSLACGFTTSLALAAKSAKVVFFFAEEPAASKQIKHRRFFAVREGCKVSWKDSYSSSRPFLGVTLVLFWMLFDRPQSERTSINGRKSCKAKVIPNSKEFWLRGSKDLLEAATFCVQPKPVIVQRRDYWLYRKQHEDVLSARTFRVDHKGIKYHSAIIPEKLIQIGFFISHLFHFIRKTFSVCLKNCRDISFSSIHLARG